MTHYRLIAGGVILQSIRDKSFDVRRKVFMSIRFPRRSLLAAMLGLGLAAAASAAESVPQYGGSTPSDVLTSQSTGVGTALVSYALTGGLVASSERDVRGGRVATQFVTLFRHRLCLLPPASSCRELSTCDDAGHLLRAGIHSSSLGTPPPLS